MPRWETCTIVKTAVREKVVTKYGGEPGIYCWEAQKAGPSGPEVIHKSREYELGVLPGLNPKALQEEEAARQELIARLTDEGWESDARDGQGRVTLRRPVGVEEESIVSQIERLTVLHRAGDLTKEQLETAINRVLGFG